MAASACDSGAITSQFYNFLYASENFIKTVLCKTFSSLCTADNFPSDKAEGVCNRPLNSILWQD
jgi:hypothetical protein